MNAMIRQAKRVHFRNKFKKAGSNTRKTWSLVNNLRGVKGRGNDGKYFVSYFGTDEEHIANEFNKFFSQVSGSAHKHPEYCTLKHSTVESAHLPLLSEDDLRSIIFGLKRNRSMGIDGISVYLRTLFDILKGVLLSLFNSIISSGMIPPNMKAAIITPIHKGGAHNRYENYRPISVLPCLTQILEKHLLFTMTSFLDKHKTLSPRQYGFVQGKGTEVLLEDFSDMLNRSFECNQVVCALFLDVSKAVDSVCHTLLLCKLSRLGFRGVFLSLLKNFLQQRTQYVSIGWAKSASLLIKAGVPQGSIISPLLFNVYVNDL